MYLLVYKGHCASVIINGIKFTSKQSTANIDDDKAHLFVDKNGNSYYSDLQVIKLEKKDVVPEFPKKQVPVDNDSVDNDSVDNEVDEEGDRVNLAEVVESLKKKYNLSELQKLCGDKGLSTSGSKTELATRLANEQG